MSSPTGVGNTSMRLKRRSHIRLRARNELLQLHNLADFFEGTDFVLLVAINSQSCRVIASVFKP